MKPADVPAPADRLFFRRTFVSRYRAIASPLDLVALFNVLLLAGFFLLNKSVFVVRPGLTLELPPAPFVEGEPYDTLVVTVSRGGLVFFDDTRLQMEDLLGAFKRARQQTGRDRLVIEADRQVPYGTLMRIHALATEAGLTHVVLATRLPPRESGSAAPVLP